MTELTCKICLNKKSCDQFKMREGHDESGYNESCKVCSQLGLYRCLNCNDLMTSSYAHCNNCKNEKIIQRKKTRKCGLCGINSPMMEKAPRKWCRDFCFDCYIKYKIRHNIDDTYSDVGHLI